MTSVFMIFELTQNHKILVPLMIANMLSFIISRRLQPVPVYHALLHQDQIHLPSPVTRSSVSPWRAADVMHRTRAETVVVNVIVIHGHTLISAPRKATCSASQTVTSSGGSN